MKQAYIYSIKVWLSTTIATPLIVTLGMGIVMILKGDTEPLGDDIGFFLACVVFGLGLSFIPFLIMCYAVFMCLRSSWSIQKTKILLVLLAFIVTAPCFVCWDIYKKNIDWYTLYLWLPYATVTSASIWFYKLDKSHEVVEAPNQV